MKQLAAALVQLQAVDVKIPLSASRVKPLLGRKYAAAHEAVKGLAKTTTKTTLTRITNAEDADQSTDGADRVE